MATIKSFTDLQQSKKLAEILPLESADMFYNEEPEDETYPKDIVDLEYPIVIREIHKHCIEEYGIPCWSLAALLNILPKSLIYTPNQALDGYCCKNITHDLETYGDNLVDACVDMILKLHELNLL